MEAALMISTAFRVYPPVRRCFISVVTVCFFLSSIGNGQLFAQEAEADFEAPIIEHEEVATGEWGEVQSFSVSVVDNQELKNVLLFHRFNDQEEFQEVEMEPLAQSAFFAARVETADVEASKIEYYFKAEDAAGNISLKGFTFDPLVRILEGGQQNIQAEIAAEPAVTETAPKPEQKKSRTLYYVLGALAVGGLAALAASSSSDGGSTSADECDPSGCRVTLTIPTP